MEERNSLFKNLDNSVQGCSDIYTDIPDYIMKDNIDKHYENMLITSYIVFAFAMLIVTKIIIAIIMAIVVKIRYSKIRKQIEELSRKD